MRGLTGEALGNAAVRARDLRCVVASVAPPFRTAYWPDSKALVAQLGLPPALADKLGEPEGRSQLVGALAAKGAAGLPFRAGGAGSTAGPQDVRRKEALRRGRRSVVFLGRCSREVVLGALELVTDGLAPEGLVNVKFEGWDALEDWETGRECASAACAYLIQTRRCRCKVVLFTELKEVPADLWVFTYDRPRVRIGWAATELAAVGEPGEFAELRESSVALRHIEHVVNLGLWPHIVLPASDLNVRLLPQLTSALLEATRGGSIEIPPLPFLGGLGGLGHGAGSDHLSPGSNRGAVRCPSAEAYAQALVAIYEERRIPLRLVSPLAWVAARVESEVPMASSLAAAGVEVAVLPDGELYAAEAAAGLESWRLGNVSEGHGGIRWERLDLMPEFFANSVRRGPCASCDWRWRCGGVGGEVVFSEEAARLQGKCDTGDLVPEGGRKCAVQGEHATGAVEAAAGPDGGGTGSALFDLYCEPRKRLFEEMLWGTVEAAADGKPRQERERLQLRQDGIDFTPVKN